MTTERERRAELAAGGLGPALVDELIAAESAGGVWCDGTIVIDASGRRCVPRELSARVEQARRASLRPSASSSPAAVVAAWVIGALLVLVVAVAEGRD